MSSEIGMNLQKKLQELTRGKVLKDEAKRLKIPYTTFQQMVNGAVKNPKIEYLKKVAEGYNLTTDELLEHNQKKLTDKEIKLKEAKDYLRYVAVNWFARERIEDLTDDEIIKIANFIKKVEAGEKAKRGD